MSRPDGRIPRHRHSPPLATRGRQPRPPAAAASRCPGRRLTEAVERIARSEDDDPATRAGLLIDLADVLPEDVAVRAAEIAPSLANPWWAGRALAALLPWLPSPARDACAARANAVAPAHLRDLLLRMPAAEQDRLIEEYLGTVWDRCAGGAPPAHAEPPDDLVKQAGPTDGDATVRAPVSPPPPQATREQREVRPAESAREGQGASRKVVNTGFAAPPAPAAPAGRSVRGSRST